MIDDDDKSISTFNSESRPNTAEQYGSDRELSPVPSKSDSKSMVVGKLPAHIEERQKELIASGPRAKFPTTYGSKQFALDNKDFDYSVDGYYRIDYDYLPLIKKMKDVNNKQRSTTPNSSSRPNPSTFTTNNDKNNKKKNNTNTEDAFQELSKTMNISDINNTVLKSYWFSSSTNSIIPMKRPAKIHVTRNNKEETSDSDSNSDNEEGENKDSEEIIENRSVFMTKTAFSSSSYDENVPFLTYKDTSSYGWVDYDPLTPILQRRELDTRLTHAKGYYAHFDQMKHKKRKRRTGNRLLEVNQADLLNSSSISLTSKQHLKSLPHHLLMGYKLGSPGVNDYSAFYTRAKPSTALHPDHGNHNNPDALLPINSNSVAASEKVIGYVDWNADGCWPDLHWMGYYYNWLRKDSISVRETSLLKAYTLDRQTRNALADKYKRDKNGFRDNKEVEILFENLDKRSAILYHKHLYRRCHNSRAAFLIESRLNELNLFDNEKNSILHNDPFIANGQVECETRIEDSLLSRQGKKKSWVVPYSAKVIPGRRSLWDSNLVLPIDLYVDSPFGDYSYRGGGITAHQTQIRNFKAGTSVKDSSKTKSEDSVLAMQSDAVAKDPSKTDPNAVTIAKAQDEIEKSKEYNTSMRSMECGLYDALIAYELVPDSVIDSFGHQSIHYPVVRNASQQQQTQLRSNLLPSNTKYPPTSVATGFGIQTLDLRFYGLDSILSLFNILNDYFRDMLNQGMLIKGSDLLKVAKNSNIKSIIGNDEDDDHSDITQSISSNNDYHEIEGVEGDCLLLKNKDSGDLMRFEYYRKLRLNANTDLCDVMIERVFGIYTGRGRAFSDGYFGQFLTHINIDQNPYNQVLTNRTIKALGTSQFLEVLSMRHFHALTDDDVLHLCKSCMNLKELDISHCYSLTDATLIHVAQNKDRLIGLRASYNENFTESGVAELLMCCDLLRILDLDGCIGIEFFGMVVKSSNGVLVQYVTRDIEVLSISNCEGMTYSNLSKNYIATALGNLTRFHCHNLKFIDDEMIISLRMGCKLLSILDLSNCHLVSNDAITYIGMSGKGDADPLTHVCLKNLADGKAFANVNEYGNRTAETKQELKYSTSRANAKPLEDKAIATLMQNCTNIRFLDISHNSHLGDNAIAGIDSKMPNLITVILDHLHISGFAIACLAERSPFLEHLSLKTCKGVSDEGLTVLAGCCPLLRSLDVTDCTQLTDVGLCGVLYKCNHLTILKAGSTVLQTDAWGGRYQQYTDLLIEACLIHAVNLRSLDVTNQCAITGTSPALQASDVGVFPNIHLEYLNLTGCEGLSAKNCLRILRRIPTLVQCITPSHKAEYLRDDFYWWAFHVNRYSHPRPSMIKQTSDKKLRPKSRLSTGKSVASSLDANSLDSFRSGLEGDSIDLIEHGDRISEMRSIDVMTERSETPSDTNNDLRASSRGSNASKAMFSRAPLLSSDRERIRKAKLAKQLSMLGPANGVAHGLAPLRDVSAFTTVKFRDMFRRRRLIERSAASTIQFAFRLHSLWWRMRRGIALRRLENWWIRMAFEKYRRERLADIRRHMACRSIQRPFREWIKNVRMCVRLQRFSRYVIAKRFIIDCKRRRLAATKIQRNVRGMIARLSDLYILAQVYMKLPLFWKQLIHSMPNAKSDIERVLDNSKVQVPVDPDAKKGPLITEDMLAKGVLDTGDAELQEGDEGYTGFVERKRVQQSGPDPRLPGDVDAILKVANAHRFQANHESIQRSLNDTRNSMDHIMENVVTNGILKPQLVGTNIIPQPFDKDAYVSLGDGRKMTFYSHFDSLLEGFKDNRGGPLDTRGLGARVHPFNIQFWPLTRPMKTEIVTSEEHDPMQDNFDVAKHERYHLDCSVCKSRLRVIHCQTCRRGFCFFCAFRQHTESSKRKHLLKLMEPRIVKMDEPNTSLIYHVTQALNASHDLRYIVKYMKSAAEIKRINDEKKLREEMEAAEERRKKAFLAAQEEAQETLHAAGKIGLLYRKWKAVRLVKRRRAQVKLEKVVNDDKTETLDVQVTRIQRLFRQYSTRMFLYQWKVNWISGNQYFTGSRKRRRAKANVGKAKNVDVLKLLERIQYELHCREFSRRSNSLAKLMDDYIYLINLIKANIDFWTKRYKTLGDGIIKMEEMIREWTETHDKDLMSLANMEQEGQSMSTFAKEKVKKLNFRTKAKALGIKALKLRLENLQNMQWWINQLMRASYRRLSVVIARYDDTQSRLEYFFRETNMVSRLAALCENRLKIFPDEPKKDMKHCREWFKNQVNTVYGYWSKLDALQESMILEEVGKIHRDKIGQEELESLIQELDSALMADSAYTAERVSIDVISMEAKSGSDRALANAEVALVLKRKQQTLQTSVIDTIKFGLEQKMSAEEDHLTSMAAFDGDDPSYNCLQMHSIECELLEKPKLHHNSSIITVFPVIMAQPWLVDLAVADVHLEEDLLEQEVELDSLQQELNRFKLMKADGEKKERTLKENILELGQEIEVYSEPIALNENIDEKNERLMTLGIMEKEKKDREMELEMTIVMNAQMDTSMLPSMEKIQELTDDIFLKKETIEKNIIERQRLAEIFFKTELSYHDALLDACSHAKSEINSKIIQLKEKLLVLQRFSAPKQIPEEFLFKPIVATEVINKEKNGNEHLYSDILLTNDEDINMVINASSVGNGNDADVDNEKKGIEDEDNTSLVSSEITNSVSLIKQESDLTTSTLAIIDSKKNVHNPATGDDNRSKASGLVTGNPDDVPFDTSTKERCLHAIHTSEELSPVEREVLHYPMGSTWLTQEHCLYQTNKRHHADPLGLVYMLVSIRVKSIQSALSVLQHMEKEMEKEENKMTEILIKETLQRYMERVNQLQQFMLKQRKQRAFQHNLDIRKKRVHTLRDARLRAMLEEKEKMDKMIAEEEEAKLVKRRNQNEKTLGQAFKDATKAALKKLKKIIRESNNKKPELDEEEKRMMQKVTGHMDEDSAHGGRPEALRYLTFTHGEKEEKLLLQQSNYIKDQGLPHYIKYNRPIGFGLNLWIQKTHEAKSMITHFEIASRDSLKESDEELNAADKIANAVAQKKASKNRPGTSDLMNRIAAGEKIDFKSMGYEAIDPGNKFKFVFWIKRDKNKIKAVSELRISFTAEEENQALDDGFTRYDKDLSDFDLPESHIWIKKIDKITSGAHATTGAIINEMVKTKELFVSNPHDKNLAKLLERHRDKLEEHYLEEQKTQVTNPITSAIELMILNGDELDQWALYFEEIDVNKEGRVSLNDIFSFLEETPTETAKEIFHSADAIDPDDDLIEFGDFMRAVGIYCMFDKDQIHRFLFTYADKLSEGSITHAQYIDLINIVNPFDKKMAKRALKEMALRADKTMAYAEFSEKAEIFPRLFFAMFKLQDKMRSKFMGVDWWVKKLRKYKGVRDRIGGDVDVDALSLIEKEKFEKDVQRKKRMDARAKEIREEKSEFRKALLQARQFMDDLSMVTDAVH